MAEKKGKKELRKIWEEVLSEARKIRDSGHVVVFTSPVDKDGITVAREIANAIATTPVGPSKAATPCGKRFTAL